MTDKVQKIRAEIERRLEDAKAGVRQNQNRVKFGLDSKQDLVIWQHLEGMAAQLLSFIDSMQEEPVSEDLEEAAKHYLYSNILYDDVYVGNPTDKDCIEMFKVGANWQKQNDEKALNENALLYNARLEGIEIGKAEMKQQMMTEAKDGVITFDYYGDNDKIYGCIAHDSFSLEELGLKDADKVKLIIIKED